MWLFYFLSIHIYMWIQVKIRWEKSLTTFKIFSVSSFSCCIWFILENTKKKSRSVLQSNPTCYFTLCSRPQQFIHSKFCLITFQTSLCRTTDCSYLSITEIQNYIMNGWDGWEHSSIKQNLQSFHCFFL